MRRMNARIVASEKCWSGIEEKMPEISREVTQLRIGLNAPGTKFFCCYLKILMGENWFITS